MFSRRIFTIREERSEKYGFVTVRCDGFEFVLTAIRTKITMKFQVY